MRKVRDICAAFQFKYGTLCRAGAKKNNLDKAISLLNKAIAIEDQLNYNEPPDWFFSVRHYLGAVLLKAGKYAEAEQLFNLSLKLFAEQGSHN